jgi:hypothetical protein
VSVRALTPQQQADVAALIASGVLQVVPPDPAKAERFLDQAAAAVGEVARLSVAGVIYDIAYNAAHDVGEAMLAAYGLRTASGAGQHVAVGQFLEAVFDGPPGQDAARRYDQIRSARNGMRYRAQPVGKATAELALDAARGLLAGADARRP